MLSKNKPVYYYTDLSVTIIIDVIISKYLLFFSNNALIFFF